MDGIPTPGHLSRLPYHWGSGSHFPNGRGSLCGCNVRTVRVEIVDSALVYRDGVTGRLAPEGTFRDNQREYITESACDGALSLARTARAPSSGRPSPFLQLE